MVCVASEIYPHPRLAAAYIATPIPVHTQHRIVPENNSRFYARCQNAGFAQKPLADRRSVPSISAVLITYISSLCASPVLRAGRAVTPLYGSAAVRTTELFIPIPMDGSGPDRRSKNVAVSDGYLFYAVTGSISLRRQDSNLRQSGLWGRLSYRCSTPR